MNVVRKVLCIFFSLMLVNLSIFKTFAERAVVNESFYKTAVDSYNKNRMSSVWIIETILRKRSAKDKKFFRSYIRDHKKLVLGKARFKGDTIFIQHEGIEILVKPIDISEGLVQVEGKEIDFSTKNSLENIVNSLEGALSKKTFSLLLLNLFIPDANAAGVLLPVVGVLALLGPLAAIVYDNVDRWRDLNYIEKIDKSVCNKKIEKIGELSSQGENEGHYDYIINTYDGMDREIKDSIEKLKSIKCKRMGNTNREKNHCIWYKNRVRDCLVRRQHEIRATRDSVNDSRNRNRDIIRPNEISPNTVGSGGSDGV